MELEISAVELPGIDIDIIQGIAKRMGARFHLRKYHGPPRILDNIIDSGRVIIRDLKKQPYCDTKKRSTVV